MTHGSITLECIDSSIVIKQLLIPVQSSMHTCLVTEQSPDHPDPEPCAAQVFEWKHLLERQPLPPAKAGAMGRDGEKKNGTDGERQQGGEGQGERDRGEKQGGRGRGREKQSM